MKSKATKLTANTHESYIHYKEFLTYHPELSDSHKYGILAKVGNKEYLTRTQWEQQLQEYVGANKGGM